MDDKYNIFVSAAAIEQIKSFFSKKNTPDAYLRLGVQGGGCNGFTYFLQLENTKLHERDLIFTDSGVNIVVDSKSIIYLNGCTLDWENTLLKHGFKFINPNAKSACSCKKSFSV